MAAARAAAQARSALGAVDRLHGALDRTKAVMNRHLTPLQIWLSSNNPTFRNFYHEIEEGRVGTEDRYNKQRATVDNSVNPGFFRELSVAALSLDGSGLTHYGAYTVRLRTGLIANRSSVFEENPFYFCEHHGVVSGSETPLGYRAVWAERADLGVAKLQAKVMPHMAGDDAFAQIIMGPNRDDPDCDFIEVHIYDGVHRDAIESVAGPKPTGSMEEIFWDDVKAKLAALGATVEEH